LLSKGTPFDVDKLVIAIGECKENIEIDGKNIDNLVNIKKKLDNSGIECYLVFSKTADTFLPSEIERFKRLANEKHIKPILFTSQELEPYRPYWDLEKENTLPHKYPIILHEIAANSLYIYLSQ
jgi:hypothetical protein